MSKSLSATKRVQTALRNNIRNKRYKSSVKSLIKKALIAINSNNLTGNSSQASLYVSQAYSKIDKAVKKGVMPKNSGARRKSILANKLKKLLK